MQLYTQKTDVYKRQIHSHAAGLLLPIPEGQAGLPLYKGDLPLLLLVGQPQLGADGCLLYTSRCV